MLIASPVQAGAVKTLEFQPYEPIVLSVDLELADNETAVTWLRSSDDLKYLEINDGKEIAVWAHPGDHELWLGATITATTKQVIPVEGGKTLEVVTGVTTRKAEFDYRIKVLGQRPPPINPDKPDVPVVPDEPVEPTTPAVSGNTYCVIFRNTEDVTEASGLRQAILDLHDFADGTEDVYVIEADIDEDAQPAKSYIDKMPSDAKLPYYFISRPKDSDGKAYIFHQGTLKTSKDVLAQIKEARDAS